MDKRVLAIVATYFPKTGELQRLLEALVPQVGLVLVIDNTPEYDDRVVRALSQLRDQQYVRLHRFGQNRGIAAAFNVGFDRALQDGWEYVLLSDQDSVPAPDMVANLRSVASSLAIAGVPVGSVNPLYVDQVTGRSFGFQVQRPGHAWYSTSTGAEANPWIEITSGISSGALIPTTAIRRAGNMREDYFIDYVDTEWFHRARSKGLKLFGTARARLLHSEGEKAIPVWYLRWRLTNTYSPPRLYYRFRNFVVLCRERHVPLAWKLRAAWFWLGIAYVHLIFAGRRLESARYMAMGVIDGLRRRMGPFEGRGFR